MPFRKAGPFLSWNWKQCIAIITWSNATSNSKYHTMRFQDFWLLPSLTVLTVINDLAAMEIGKATQCLLFCWFWLPYYFSNYLNSLIAISPYPMKNSSFFFSFKRTWPQKVLNFWGSKRALPSKAPVLRYRAYNMTLPIVCIGVSTLSQKHSPPYSCQAIPLKSANCPNPPS